jgi:glucokinase
MSPSRSMPITTMPSRPSQMRQANARGLLQLLQENSPCSKADLVRYSGLSAPTVSSSISQLEGLGLVESMGDGASKGGRPPGLLRFNARHGYVAAVDIGGTRIRMMLADLGGTVVAQWSVLLAAKQKTPDAICALILEGLRVMCRDSGNPIRKVMHLTAGAPGITNVDAGIVISAPNLQEWNDVPLKSLLERATSLPCIVENDTNLAAIGEHWRGAACGIDNFVFVALGTGVGTGIYIHGRLHHGSQWSAGEIGYFGMSSNKRLPVKVRELGQLETAIGGSGIEREWARAIERAVASSSLDAARAQKLKMLKPTEVFDLAAEGDRTATEVLRYVAGVLTDAITDICLLLNPEVVVLGGGVGSHKELCRATEKLIRKHEFAQPHMRSSSLGTQAQLYGGLSLSLAAIEERMFE